MFTKNLVTTEEPIEIDFSKHTTLKPICKPVLQRQKAEKEAKRYILRKSW